MKNLTLTVKPQSGVMDSLLLQGVQRVGRGVSARVEDMRFSADLIAR